MSSSFDGYVRIGHRRVRGWAQREVFSLLRLIDSEQRSAGISGAVAEIGVHHGQLFIGLALLQAPGQKAVAIDVFDDQELNIDQSGKGDRAIFESNVAQYAPGVEVAVHQGDSTQLEVEALGGLAGGAVRIFSVDGGHTDEVVYSDMLLAERTLSPGGVVVADDVFNSAWPEVVVGTLRYMERESGLIPFAIGYNKVFFTQPDHCARYRDVIAARYGDRLLYHCRESTFRGFPVILVAPVQKTPRELLSRSSLVRSVYRRLVPSN